MYLGSAKVAREEFVGKMWIESPLDAVTPSQSERTPRCLEKFLRVSN